MMYLKTENEKLDKGRRQLQFMKKTASIVLATCLCNLTYAQVVIALLFGDKLNTGSLEFGIVVAPGSTDISNIVSKRRENLSLGIYFNIHPDKKFFFHIEGIAKGSFGAESLTPYPVGNDTLNDLFANSSVERKIKAFSLPILGRYAITPKLFVEAGIQPDMLLKSKDIFTTKVNDNELTYETVISDQVALLDFGVAGGLFYKFRKDKRSMGIGIRYFQGLTDILPATTGNQANNSWQLNITIPIGAGKVNASSTKSAGH
jgi:outer membrane protein with beta-barrel domain